MAEKWDYYIDVIRKVPVDSFGISNLAPLSERGRQGWELVAVVPALPSDKLGGLYYYFKRPAPAASS